jgi:hypothetical protein
VPRFLIAAGRRGLAAVVLFLAGLAAFDAATFKVWHVALPPQLALKPMTPKQLETQFNCSISHNYCAPVTPGWAIPLAIVVGLFGILIAALIYRPRPVGRVGDPAVCVGS